MEQCQSNNTEYLTEEPKIIIYNSTFHGLDVNPVTKALITQCNIDGQLFPRPTLTHFENFINENSSTILHGSSNSHVTIENSVFIKHNSSEGVLFLQNNSSLQISNSLILYNIVTSLGYSSITLYDGTNAAVNSTTFKNNSGLAGGSLIAVDQCQVTLTNCTFSSNEAITTEKTANIQKISNKVTTEKTANIQKILSLQRTSHSSHGNATYKPISPTTFNLTTLRYLPRAPHTRDLNNTRSFMPISLRLFNLTTCRETIASDGFDLLVTRSTSKKNSDLKKGVLSGFGAAVYLAIQSHLLVTNCTFENNSAKMGGVIAAQQNVTLGMQETIFVVNKALANHGGAIEIKHQVQLSITSCLIEDNSCQQLGGAIDGTDSITLDIHMTNFTRNRAQVQGGPIHIDTDAHLRSTDCTFSDNYAGAGGAIAGDSSVILEINGLYFSENSASNAAGAIAAGNNATLDIQGPIFVGNTAWDYGGAIIAKFSATVTFRETTFVRNKASRGWAGAIDVEYQAHLRVRNCVFDKNICEGVQCCGGAINGACNTTLDIQETNFTRNTADSAGAINVNDDVYLRVADCTFYGNYAKNVGGAMVAGYETVFEINRSYFLENSARLAGVITAGESITLHVQETSFVGNTVSMIGAIWIQNQVHL